MIYLSCQSDKKETTSVTTADPELMSKGFALLSNNCFSCHNPDPTVKETFAPNMIGIYKAYRNDAISLTEFNNDLHKFLNDPSIKNVRLKDAISKFGVMPLMNYSDEDIQAMGTYLYYNDLTKSDWFSKTYNEHKLLYIKDEKQIDPMDLAKSIAMQTKGILGKNLLNAINTKGTDEALEFCSTKAISLTDSMAVALNAEIKRVSDFNRNKDNAASKEELQYIIEAKQLLKRGHDVKPKLIEENNHYTAYLPIMTNDMCLQCHGMKGEDVAESTLSKLKELYPGDKATGYKSNEIRGIWVVEFDKE